MRNSSLLRLLLLLALMVGVFTSAHAQGNVTVDVDSTPITGVTVTTSLPDSTGATSGVTNFTLLYTNIFNAVTITLTAPATSGGETFANWTLNGVAQPAGQTTVAVLLTGTPVAVAVYNTPNETVTVSSVNPASGVTISAAPADVNGLTSGVTTFALTYANFSRVSLTAPATAGAGVFSKWTLNGVDQPPGQATVTFGLTGNETAVATYVTPDYTLSVQSVDPAAGVAVTTAPADINGKTGGNTAFTLTYPNLTNVTLTAPATEGNAVFSNWTINGVAQPTGQVAVQTTISANSTAIATYVTPIYTLTVQSVDPVKGVTIAATPADNNGKTGGITPFGLTYTNLASVALTAPATEGTSVFSKWTVNGVSQPAGQASVQISMTANTTAVAVYTTPTYTLSVQSIDPASGVTVTTSPADNNGATGGSTAFSLTYTNLTAVTLTAPGTAGPGVFSKWTLNGVAQPAGQTSLHVTMTANTAAIAVYVTPDFTLTVQSVNPATGIAVTASPADVNAKTGGSTAFTLTYPNTTVVTLTAPAKSGINNFTKWTVNGVDQTAGVATVKVTVAASVTAVATYTTPTFTVVAAVSGANGTVSPSGNAPVLGGTNQTLTATPSPGYVVKQWLLDGVVAQTGGTTFELTDVIANHTVLVSFVVILVYHPADTNKDARISISEVTAYGEAWKLGKPWPTAPSLIPQSYITNAIMLWKSGEAYTYLPSQTAPAGWIPASIEPLLAKPAVVARSSSSSVSSIMSPGSGWWQVNVTVTPASNTQAYTLEEHLPKGAQVQAISSGGVYDPKGLTLRWGPFTDANVRIFSYRIKLSGAATLTGSASFNGVDATTTGSRSVGGKS